jgi:RNA polymerase sigma-70 factor (sigma-E family)
MEREIELGRARRVSVAELYDGHAARAGRLAYVLTRDPDLAQDVMQEAFSRLIVRLPVLRRPDAVEAYLRRSVVNLCRKHWRRSRRERAYLERQGPLLSRTTDAMPNVAEAHALQRALDLLPYRQRAALVLRFYEDLSERDAARCLGCAVGTIKSLVSRGLRSLREELGDEDVD